MLRRGDLLPKLRVCSEGRGKGRLHLRRDHMLPVSSRTLRLVSPPRRERDGVSRVCAHGEGFIT